MSETREMKRTLTLLPVVLFGFSFMALGTVFSTYGVASQISHGMVAGSYILATIVMLFTAYSYGQMAKVFPIAGSAYTYTQKAINPHVGFLVGWSLLMDYLLIPLVNYLLFGIFYHAAFPNIPSSVWILSMLILVTIVNIRGVKLANKANIFITIFGVAFIILFCVLAIQAILHGEGTGQLLTSLPFYNPQESFSFIIAGAALLCFSFLGFDSVTTFSEETIQPERNIPRAVFIITIVGGLIFTTVSYIAHNVWPDYMSFENPDSASHEIILLVSGKFVDTFFLVGTAFGIFGSAMASQASAARVLYAMGRDGQLPKKYFGSLHSKFQTPVNNILVISLISLLALVVSLTLVASFINFGAFLAFTFVNLSVIGHYFIRKRQRTIKGTFLYLIFPVIGAVLDIWLLLSLDIHSKILGSIWVVVGVIYLTYITKGFKMRPPEMELSA
ncbi:APC family permease [Brevibacillus fluminis]|uniref:APC family permease n=1 Tax=Brevibacillus fluminis TaxID=511487 RepID=A0A3M8DVW9_9BACL|nr:APC family permease [Brevibacillus fluminis]RNB91635.1 APC family permease [Brevibacillus fluminis]